jgi:hypothetical protein
MSQVDNYPGPLKDALRDALARALEDSDAEVPDSVVVTVENETFGTVQIRVDDTA